MPLSPTTPPPLSVSRLLAASSIDSGTVPVGLAGKEREADAIAKTLLTELRAATSPASRTHVLRGIANSGHPSAFHAVRVYLKSESVKERTAAVDALRLMSVAEVDTLLVKVLESEPESAVRSAAVEAIEVRTPSPALVNAVCMVAQLDKDSSVRLRAVKALGRWAPEHPEVREVLEALARGESNPRVREVAGGTFAKR